MIRDVEDPPDAPPGQVEEAGPRARRAGTQDEMYQLDAVVSLFAMVLLILITTAVAAGIGVVDIRNRTAAPEAPAFRMASIDAPFPRLETWMLHEGKLLRLDYDLAARLLLEGEGLSRGATDPVSGVDLLFEASPGAVGAYDRIEVILPAGPLEAGGVIGDALDVQDAQALSAWAERADPARLIAWPPERARIPPVMGAADAAGRAVTLTLQTGKGKFAARRNVESFSFRGILRVY